MDRQDIDQVLSEWSPEFSESISKTNALCVALFSAERELLYATPVMQSLFKGEPYLSLVNPTFDRLLSMKSENSLVFSGIMTIGNYTSINSSIIAQVFSKGGKLLIVGGVDTVLLLDQNNSMHDLNHQINNLQRQLLKEKVTLEHTLKQLSESNAALQEVIATKDKFFSIIAHDLKSPFNSISGLSNLLVEKIKNNKIEDIERYGGLILKTSNNAMDLLMNLMEWSSSQTGLMKFSPTRFDLKSCVDKPLLLYRDIAAQKGVTLKSSIPDEVFIFADDAMICTVFRNLISNAVKFTLPGGEITVSVSEMQDEILFSVSDSGIGISKGSIEKLFRVDQSFSTNGTNKETGTGLGLILCKEFIEKHKGKIWVESELNIGSVFYFTLPHNAALQE